MTLAWLAINQEQVNIRETQHVEGCFKHKASVDSKNKQINKTQVLVQFLEDVNENICVWGFWWLEKIKQE